MSEMAGSGRNRLAINRVSPALGAEVRGGDLAAPVDDDLLAAIYLGHHAARIAGMPPNAGGALVAEINRLATRPAPSRFPVRSLY